MRKLINLIYPYSSLVSHLFGSLIVGSALIPSYLLVIWVWRPTSGWTNVLFQGAIRSLVIGISYFLFVNSLLLMIILYRQVFRLKIKETRALIISLTGLRLGAYNWMIAIAKHLALPLVRTTPLAVWFYRGIGAKVGKNTIISTTRLWDCDLIKIGDNCVIGGNVAISGHITTTMGKGILKKVQIGNRVTIGADTMIFPGVTIEDNVIVGACSMVPEDSHLEAHSIYVGVPVEKIR